MMMENAITNKSGQADVYKSMRDALYRKQLSREGSTTSVTNDGDSLHLASINTFLDKDKSGMISNVTNTDDSNKYR